MLPPKMGNQFFPLPADYSQLTAEGQRQARVALCSSWYTPDRPAELIADPQAFFYAFQFFKEYYRKGFGGNRAKYSYASPPMHREWIQLFADNPLLIMTCFRGSGKTIVFGEEVPEFCILTRPHTPVQYTSSTERLSDKQVRAVKLDLMNNSLIIDDFGKQQPSRNTGLKWATEGIELNNGSSFYAISVDSTQRGVTQLSLRSLLQIMDDWETQQMASNEEMREDAGYYMFDVFFPCADPKARRIWTNTLLDERCWAMRASYKFDHRFDVWESTDEYRAIWYPDGDTLKSRWADRYSEKDLMAMSGQGPPQKGVISYGESSFAKEFLNDPTIRSNRAFDFDVDRHTYRWEGTIAEPALLDVETKKFITLAELEANSGCVMGIDLSLGLSEVSNYSTVVVSRIDRNNVMWVMECWMARVQPIMAVQQALDMGEHWKASVLGIERIIFEQVIVDMLDDELSRRRASKQYAPDLQVFKRGGGESKPDRIMSLQYRFPKSLIKIPLGGSLNVPWASTGGPLITEIEKFTSRGTRGYDDLLDSLTTCQKIAEAGILPFVPTQHDRMGDMRKAVEAGAALAFPEDRIPYDLIMPQEATVGPVLMCDWDNMEFE